MIIKTILALLFVSIFCTTHAPAQAVRKTTAGILFDNTGSLRRHLDVEKELGKVLVESLIETGPVSLFHFANDKAPRPLQSKAIMTVGSDWSQSDTSLGAGIDKLSTVPGLTTLIDAIRKSAEKLDEKANEEKDAPSEKILVLLTDGEDRASTTKPEELIKFLTERKIRVYAIGFGDGKGLIDKSPVKAAKAFLKSLTEKTGGRLVFPKEKRSASEVVEELFSPTKSK